MNNEINKKFYINIHNKYLYKCLENQNFILNKTIIITISMM